MTDEYLFKRVTQCTSTSTLTLSSIKKKIDENHMRPKWRSGTFATFKCYVFPQENLSDVFSTIYPIIIFFIFSAKRWEMVLGARYHQV